MCYYFRRLTDDALSDLYITFRKDICTGLNHPSNKDITTRAHLKSRTNIAFYFNISRDI